MMNSSLGPCSQLHHLIFCMHFFIQETLIQLVSKDITINRSRINKNGKNLIMKLIFYLDNGFLMISLPIIHYYINLTNTLTNISNFSCLMSIVNIRSATMIGWAFTPMMLSTTIPTPQSFLVITLILLVRLKSMSSINYIDLPIGPLSS